MSKKCFGKSIATFLIVFVLLSSMPFVGAQGIDESPLVGNDETNNILYGDINGDGVVNMKDYTRLINFYEDRSVEVNGSALDVNGDGAINEEDGELLFQSLADYDVDLTCGEKITVTFDTNGGNAATATKELIFGETLGVLPEASREYFSFLGWFTQKEGGEALTALTRPETAEDFIAYAHWQANSYIASWNAGENYSVCVTRSVSPYANASLTQISSGDSVYYGDVLTVSYTPADHYKLDSCGATSITVAGDVTNAHIFASASKKPASGWTDGNTIPQDAEIVEEKWTYDLTEYTTSSSSSLSGWTRYNATWVWSDYGSWSSWTRNSASNSDSRQVETRWITTYKTQYNYSRWTEYSNGGGRNGPWQGLWNYGQTECNYYFERGWSDNQLPVYGQDGWGATMFNMYNCWEDSWYNEVTRQVENGGYNEYRYRDRSKIYTHYYFRVLSKESSSYPTGSNISNITRMVKYIEK